MSEHGISVWGDTLLDNVDEEEELELLAFDHRGLQHRLIQSRLTPLEARRAVEELMDHRRYQSLHDEFYKI